MIPSEELSKIHDFDAPMATRNQMVAKVNLVDTVMSGHRMFITIQPNFDVFSMYAVDVSEIEGIVEKFKVAQFDTTVVEQKLSGKITNGQCVVSVYVVHGERKVRIYTYRNGKALIRALKIPTK